VQAHCVSNVSLRALATRPQDIAPQRKTPYQGSGKKDLQHPMVEHVSGMPDGAVNVSTGGFNRFVGPLFRLPETPGDEIRRFAFLVTDKHMNSAGTVHGGMLMAFADVAMGQTARAATGAKSCSTVSLNCDFVGPGRLGDTIEARVKVTRRARTMVFLSAELVTGDRTVLVATGLWKVTVEP
jgi:uncharacterized protein (TIGR00369 family)